MRRAALPRWANLAAPLFGVLVCVAPAYLVALAWYGASPETTDVGYRPAQPAPFSHAMHAGQLEMDCRYCHSTVERAAHAAVPTTETCMICHKEAGGTWTESDELALVRQSAATGAAIAWVRVHDLPDYVFFDHSAHVRRGVGCTSCHGRVDEMELVAQEHTLSMGWCLDCHRVPEPHLRPPSEMTNMGWSAPGDAWAHGRSVREALHVDPSTDCTACHR